MERIHTGLKWRPGAGCEEGDPKEHSDFIKRRNNFNEVNSLNRY